MPTKHGSPEHFNQVVAAHVITYYGPWQSCRCGKPVGPSRADYRAHIAAVWSPWPLPTTFITENS